MPRPPRISLEDALYYITSRCIYNQEIFKEESDYQAYYELIKKYKEQYKFKLYAYALMPSHFHLLLELPDPEQEEAKGGISEIMHGLNSSYTKYFNGKYGRKGHLFRDRFKTALVEKDTYLLKLTAYIHLNPQKLNLLFAAKDYPYSSYALYINKEMPLKDLMQEEKNIVLGLLGQKPYEQFMQEMASSTELNFHNQLQKKGILGGGEFQSRVRAKFDNTGEKPEEKDEEENKEGAKNPYIKVGITVLLVVLAGLGLTLLVKFALKAGNKGVIKDNRPVFLVQEKIINVNPKPAEKAVVYTVPKRTKDPMEGTVWQIKLTPVSGGAVLADTLNFSGKKFISANLEQKKFAPSNYSVRMLENGKITWETMQNSPEGIALWRADISTDGRMRGVLSLRKEGLAVQDFTFSGEYWRADNGPKTN